MSMRTLHYYFGKKTGDDAGVAGLSCEGADTQTKSPRRQPTFNMVIRKRKRAVGSAM